MIAMNIGGRNTIKHLNRQAPIVLHSSKEDEPKFGMPITKVFRKVLADGRNSVIVLSFGSSFG